MADVNAERMKHMKNRLHGYMTLEAALLMPTVWLSLFFIIFVGFFQYDRCVAEQDSKMMLLRASEMRGKDEAAVIRTVMEKGELAGKKKLLFSEGVQKKLQVKNDRVTVRVSGNVNTILKKLNREGELNIFSYAAEYEVKKYDPVQFIRTCRRIKNYGTN